MNNNDKREALGKLNKAILEAIGAGLQLSATRIFGSDKTQWAIMIDENVDFDGTGLVLSEVKNAQDIHIN